MKKKYWLMIILFFLTASYIGWKYQSEKIFIEFKQFNEASISGRIIFVEKYSREATFKIENDPNIFKFYPITSHLLNSSHIFDYLARSGDSVWKPAYSDTLFLYKGRKIYRYTFQKFNKK